MRSDGLAKLAPRRGGDPPVRSWLQGADMSTASLWSAGAGLKGLDEGAGDGLLGTLLGDQQPAGQVDRHAGPADDGEHGKHDPDDCHVDAELLGDAGGHSGQHPVSDRSAQLLRPGGEVSWRVGRGGVRCVHGSSVPPRPRQGNREDPRFHPEDVPAGSGSGRIAGRAVRGDDGCMKQRAGSAPQPPRDHARGQAGPWMAWSDGDLQPERSRRRHPFRRRRRTSRWTRGRWGSGPLRRGREDRLGARVASGLAARTGFDMTTVRLVFVVITLASGGTGAMAYVLAWLLVPTAGDDANIASTALTDRR